jgi:hypothetical protein
VLDARAPALSGLDAGRQPGAGNRCHQGFPCRQGIGGLAAWVPAVTTVSASLTAHVAASQYDHRIVEFLGTAEQLEGLRGAGAAEAMGNGAFVDA